MKQTQTPVQTAVDKVTRTNISHLQDRGRRPASGFHFWQCFHYCQRHHNHQHHHCCVIKPFAKVLRSGVSERRGFSLNPKRKSSASLRLSSLAPSSPPSTLSLFLQSSMRSRSVRQEKWMKSYFRWFCYLAIVLLCWITNVSINFLQSPPSMVLPELSILKLCADKDKTMTD